MSYQIKLLGCFLNRRNKPAVKRLAQLLINGVAVMGAEHREGLPHSSVYLAAPSVSDIIKGEGSRIARRIIQLYIGLLNRVDKAFLCYTRKRIVGAVLLKPDRRRKGKQKPTLDKHFKIRRLSLVRNFRRAGVSDKFFRYYSA